jgi:hypothetical protein
MDSKYMKKCSTSLAIKETQIKRIFRFLLTPVRMAIIKGNNNKCWQVCGKTGTLIHCWWECKLITTIMECSMDPQKAKNRAAI